MGEGGGSSSSAMVDFESNYEIARVARFIRTGNFARVALQFPDELLKDSTKVVSTLREKLRSLRRSCNEDNGDVRDIIGLYVMADTTYGSCCVDEVAASHINADCVIHYGLTCLSPTTKLPALFVFGKSSVSASNCAKSLCNYASTVDKPILVLFGLEYAHAIHDIKEASMVESAKVRDSTSRLGFHFADVMCSVVNPSENFKTCDGHEGLVSSSTADEGCEKTAGKRYKIGGLTWNVPDDDCKIDDYALFWIGSDGPAFANVVLRFNGCDIVRYDATEDRLLTDFSQQKRILKRRYYLVEKAKDAAIVGILVGTLGVAGYLSMIHQMKELITRAGKKAYTLVMGRPNPAKLANFPECNVFIYVSCAQTALLDSKEFLAPVITPFEAILAFNRGSQWTGEYVMSFQDLISSCPAEVENLTKEARFSFLRGGYVEDFDLQESVEEEDKEVPLALANVVEKALRVRDKDPRSLIKSTANSGAEFLAARSYQGLDINGHSPSPQPFFVGRTGKASGYDGEKSVK